LLFSGGLTFLTSCLAPTDSGDTDDEISINDGEDSGSSNPSGWTIPINEVYDGGPGKDGIPAISNPSFTSVDKITYLQDSDLVVGVNFNGESRAYPHPILDWHEIVNDNIGGYHYSVTYCPLTGSALNWSSTLDGSVTTFGVSGLLYNTNLIPYDRATDSYWSQMLMESVKGDMVGTKADLLPLVETTWATWKALYPESQVMTTETGVSRPYGSYPYGSYRTAESLIFPISTTDSRLHMKERVAGIVVDGRAKVYRFDSFPDSLRVINDSFRSELIVVVGSKPDQLLTIYGRQLTDGTVLELTPIQGQLPAVMTDQEGNRWDIFGHAVSGLRAGSSLPVMRTFIAYWFAYGTFYPPPEIYSD